MSTENLQKQINQQGQAYIEGLRSTVHQLWEKCCEEDGMPADTKFAVFSEGNKYLPFYNKALQELWEAQEQYKAGGYVGLRISKR